jgi:hypothetical protein
VNIIGLVWAMPSNNYFDSFIIRNLFSTCDFSNLRKLEFLGNRLSSTSRIS